MDSNPVKNHQNGLSVVIATLGGDSINRTVENLLNGSMVPDEILLCLPGDQSHKVSHLASPIVKIIATADKGQVKQRAIGFHQAGFEMVLQLDDDLLLEKNAVQKLVACLLKLGKANSVGPIYYGHHTGRCIHEVKTGLPGVWKNLFDSIICAAPWGIKKMGRVTAIGINYGVDDAYSGDTLFATQWLPGGCVLSFNENLVKEDFFPFAGKAYCEDLLHSYLRIRSGNRLWVAPDVIVHIDEPEPEFTKTAVAQVIRIRRYYLHLVKGPQARLFLYELFCKLRSNWYNIASKKDAGAQSVS